MKKFNHSYQLHHRDTLVDVPLRSAGKCFILAPVPGQANRFGSSCHGETQVRTPQARSLASIPILLSIVIRYLTRCPDGTTVEKKRIAEKKRILESRRDRRVSKPQSLHTRLNVDIRRK